MLGSQVNLMASSRIGPGQVFSCEKAHLVFWFLNSQIELTDGLPLPPPPPHACPVAPAGKAVLISCRRHQQGKYKTEIHNNTEWGVSTSLLFFVPILSQRVFSLVLWKKRRGSLCAGKRERRRNYYLSHDRRLACVIQPTPTFRFQLLQ